MKVLVINAGSSSLKYQLIDMQTEKAVAKGGCERIGIEGSFLKHTANGKEVIIEKAMPDHKVAVQLVLEALADKDHGAISSMNEIDAVGHRVVHSGEEFTGSVLITPEVLKKIEALSDLAPLHEPANVTGIKACMAIMPSAPQVAVFDTAFHSTMPDYAYMYAVPYEDYKCYKVRRYGFHGSSHLFVSQEAAKYLGRNDLKIVTCHLGNGSSISAVKNGKCMDTSMGFTPLAGVPMGTRSGDIDPAIIEYLGAKKNMSVSEVLTYLNKKSGMLGISGVSSDFRDLSAASEAGNDRARLALDMFAYATKKYVGAYAAAMGGIDCLVFTAGIGENDSFIRAKVTEGLEFLGIEIDKEENNKRTGDIHDITAKGGKVKVLVIPTNEELVIARDTARLSE